MHIIHSEWKSVLDRFWKHVYLPDNATDEDCWEWVGANDGHGYGHFLLHGRKVKAHRVSWMLYRGELDKNDVLCHTCDCPSCINPHHLIKSNQSYNITDAVKKGLIKIGEEHHNAKLSDKQILEIKSLKGIIYQKDIAIMFSVSQQHVSDILSNKYRTISPLE